MFVVEKGLKLLVLITQLVLERCQTLLVWSESFAHSDAPLRE
jgi:hypothetical protein